MWNVYVWAYDFWCLSNSIISVFRAYGLSFVRFSLRIAHVTEIIWNKKFMCKTLSLDRRNISELKGEQIDFNLVSAMLAHRINFPWKMAKRHLGNRSNKLKASHGHGHAIERIGPNGSNRSCEILNEWYNFHDVPSTHLFSFEARTKLKSKRLHLCSFTFERCEAKPKRSRFERNCPKVERMKRRRKKNMI